MFFNIFFKVYLVTSWLLVGVCFTILINFSFMIVNNNKMLVKITEIAWHLLD